MSIPTSCNTCSHFYHCQGFYLGAGCEWEGEQLAKQERRNIWQILKHLFRLK